MSIERRHNRIISRNFRLTFEHLRWMKIDNDFLNSREKFLFIEILFEFEDAIAFDDSKMKMLNFFIESFIIIHIVFHIFWQRRNVRFSKIMQEVAIEMIKKKLNNEIFEFSQESYRSSFFLIEKKEKDTYRMINDIQMLNKIIIRDSEISFVVNEFSKNFVNFFIIFAIDYYFNYF